MSQKLLSIIVPVYKVEIYINKCLDSLLVPKDQLELLDIVIINDGTPDRSADMAREYEKRYPGIFRVIDQENRGHGGAWNHGTELATGKYLFYLDSDDWFDTEQFSKLIDFLGTCDTDMVLMARTKYYAYENREEIVELGNMDPDRIYDAGTYDWLHCGNGPNITYAHNTAYRTSMMQKYLPIFCEHVMYDDVILQVMPIMVAESFVYTKLNVYHYLIGRPGQSFDPAVRAKHADNVTVVLKQVMAFIGKNRNVPPEGSTRKEWSENLYSAFPAHHYRELSIFGYQGSRDRLFAWDAYVKEHYPDIRLTRTVRQYRRLPYPAFFVWFKVSESFARVKRYIDKRCFNKKR